MATPRKRASGKRTPAEKKAIALMLEKLANEGKVAPLADPAKAKRMREQRKRKRTAEGKGLEAKDPCPGRNIRGEPCKAVPLDKGTVVNDVEVSGKYCLFHDPDLPPDTWRNYKQKQGTTEISRNVALPRAMDLLANAVNQSPQLLFEPHFKALGLKWNPDTLRAEPDIVNGKRRKGATLVGFSREGVARKSNFADAALQVKVAEQLADRLYGKARVSMEIGAGIGVGTVQIPADEERAVTVANILHEVGALPDAKPTPKTARTAKKTPKTVKS